jgi:hypothetical protein
MSQAATNRLFFGDNLHVLRESVKDESVDLVYCPHILNTIKSMVKTPFEAKTTDSGWFT